MTAPSGGRGAEVFAERSGEGHPLVDGPGRGGGGGVASEDVAGGIFLADLVTEAEGAVEF